MNFAVVVEVSALEGIADPEAATIERALPLLGFAGVSGMKVGRIFRFELDANDITQATELAEDLCHRLLANPVIQKANVTVAPAEGSASGADA